MFGYVKPFKPELKVRELELYRAVYCGLCRNLEKRYGAFSSLFVSYDMAFAAMLLYSGNKLPGFGTKRCVVSPFKKKPFVKADYALDVAADASVIVTYYKLRDNISDDGFFKRLISRAAAFLLKPAFKKASKRLPSLSEETLRYTALLSRLESENCQSLDRVSDCTGRFLMTIGDYAPKDGKLITEILYKLSRFITIADAAEDYEDDLKKKCFNMIRASYGEFGEKEKNSLRITMTYLRNDLFDLAQRLDKNVYYPIILNTLTFGIHDTQIKVLEGEKRPIAE